MNPPIGDGVCHDELNTETCKFDGGDCISVYCGHCEAITVTLDYNTLLYQGHREGIYFNSSLVNGKPSWTSTSNAIWFVKGLASYSSGWMIGLLSSIGQGSPGMYSESVHLCPFDIPSEQWYYYSAENVWELAGQNEIKLECLTGSHFYNCICTKYQFIRTLH